MAKIDTSKIEGYESMSIEDKLKALEALEYDDNSAELERLKNANSKSNSEAAEWKRKYQAQLSEDEKKKQEDADKLADMAKELAALKLEKTISEHKASFIAQGYSEDLAASSAKALAEGDTKTVFANQQKFLTEYTKQIKADALKDTPKPPAGAGGSGAIDYDKKIEDAQKNGDLAAVAYYNRLRAQEAAENK